MEFSDKNRISRRANQRGSSTSEYAVLLSVTLVLIAPIVSMMKATEKPFERYGLALCGGGSDSTIGSTDENCWEKFLFNNHAGHGNNKKRESSENNKTTKSADEE